MITSTIICFQMKKFFISRGIKWIFLCKKISVVIPVYNEEGNINAVAEKIDSVFQTLPDFEYEVIFVDDGSADDTLPIVMSLAANNNHNFISLFKDFGKDMQSSRSRHSKAMRTYYWCRPASAFLDP